MARAPILETRRLWLREFDEGDAEPFFRLLSDPSVLRYTGDPGPGVRSVDDALAVLRSHPLADYAKHGYGRWACVLKASDAVIGFAGLKFLADCGEVDIGYRFLPAYWGQGLASEACRAVFDYGRERLGLKRIRALVIPENVASVRILEKLGLEAVGPTRYAEQWFTKYVFEERSGEREPARGSPSSPPAR